MHHRDQDAYRIFCSYVSRTKTLDYRTIVSHVMKESGGATDPNRIVEWIDMWVMMCEALFLHRGIPLPDPLSAIVAKEKS